MITSMTFRNPVTGIGRMVGMGRAGASHGHWSVHEIRDGWCLQWGYQQGIGMIQEGKQVEIAFTPKLSGGDFIARRAQAALEAVAPYERDGWIGQSEDLFNRYNLVGKTGETYKVWFRRWVPKATAATVEASES